MTTLEYGVMIFVLIIYIPLYLPLLTFLLFWKKDKGRRYITFLRAAIFSLMLGVVTTIGIYKFSYDTYAPWYLFHFMLQAIVFICLFAIGSYLKKKRSQQEKVTNVSKVN